MDRAPATRSRAAMVALLCVAQFVVVLDVTIVAVALPAIQRGLGFATPDLQWVVSAYTLAFAGFLILAGRLADTHGRRRVLAAGLALFGGASLACGLSGAPAVLVAARVVQGLGAAAVAPAALATITATIPDGPARRRALGAWTAAAAGGGATGWLLGGVLTQELGWPWVFLVNVPIVLAAVVLLPAIVPETRARRDGRRRLDVAGAATITAALALLVLGLTRAEADGPGSPQALGGVALGGVLLVAFARIEARAPDPLLPPALLRADGLPTANVVAAILTATTSGPLLLCVLALGAEGRSPTETGLLFAPVNLAVIAGSVLGPLAARILGLRHAMAAGLAGVGAGTLWLTAAGAGPASPLALVPAFVAMGLGLGCAAVASTASGVAAAGAAHEGVASGLLNTAAQVGTAMGVAVLITIAGAAGERAAFAGAAALALTGAVAVAARRQPAGARSRSSTDTSSGCVSSSPRI